MGPSTVACCAAVFAVSDFEASSSFSYVVFVVCVAVVAINTTVIEWIFLSVTILIVILQGVGK